MSADEIRAELEERWQDDPAAQVCLRIVNFIVNLPIGEQEFLTFRSLSHAAGKDGVDSELLKAVMILASSKIAALDARALLVDDDDTEHEIDPEELAEARRSGELVHPETGEIIVDFEDRVVPFFVPSARLVSAT